MRLLYVVGTVGVEIDLCLLIIKAREVADAVALLHDAQSLFGEFYGITHIAQAVSLLNIVVVFRRQSGDVILDSDACVCLSATLQLLQSLVRSADAETVENRPVQTYSNICSVV